MTDVEYKNTCYNPLGLCKTSDKEKFWLDDPTELYRDGKYTQFIPLYKTSSNQQLNSFTRLAIYMIILILLFGRGEILLIVPVTLLILVILFKKFKTFDKKREEKELDKIITIRKEETAELDELKKKEYMYDGQPHYKTWKEMAAEEEKAKGYDLKAGSYDSDNMLTLGTKQNPSAALHTDDKSLYTVDELVDYQQNTCRKPTNDNPLMNLPVTEFGNGDPPASCNSDDKDIKDQIKMTFNHQLFRSVGDVFERENSQRQFYTTPTAGNSPNNSVEFARWLYKLPSSAVCKGEQEGCLRYDDVRFRIR